jgi:proteasome lid subunit RPN8/RPN11
VSILLEKIENLLEQIYMSDQFLKKEIEQVAKSEKEIQSVLFLKDNQVIGNKRHDIATGSYKSVQFNIEDVLAKALELGANTVVGIHNHPNQTAHPSRADIETFRHMKDIFAKHNIRSRAYVTVFDGFAVRFTEYDEATQPELHTMDYLIKAQDSLKELNIQFDPKDLEQKLSKVENIVDFEREFNKYLEKYNLHFTPRGAPVT